MTRTAAEKMGVKAGARALFIGAPDAVLESEKLPRLERVEKDADFIQLFVTSEKDMEARFAEAAARLAPGGALWLAWPKRSGAIDSDLRLPKVIEIGYRHGLVESKTIGLDADWSAIKFTHPKPGKRYANSYGRLPAQR